MKVLILYKDWLLLNRGEIRPEVGDIVQIVSAHLIKYPIVEIEECGGIFLEVKTSPIYSNRIYTYVESCFVEIDYNFNELNEFKEIANKHFDELSSKLAIEFAEWLLNRPITTLNIDDNKTVEIPFTHQLLIGELIKNSNELYKQFIDNKGRNTITN